MCVSKTHTRISIHLGASVKIYRFKYVEYVLIRYHVFSAFNEIVYVNDNIFVLRNPIAYPS